MYGLGAQHDNPGASWRNADTITEYAALARQAAG